MVKRFMLYWWTLEAFSRQSVYQAMGIWELGGYITVIKQCFILRIHRKSMSFNEWRLIIVYFQGMGFLLFALGFIDSLFSCKGISLCIPGKSILRLQEAIGFSTPRSTFLTGMSTEKTVHRLDVPVL